MPVYDTLWSCSRLLPDCPHCWYSSVWVTTFLSECYQSTQSPQQNYQLRVQDDILPLRQHGNTCNVPTAIHVLYLQKYMYCTYSNTCTELTEIHVLYLQKYMYCTYNNTCIIPTAIHVLYLQKYMYCTYNNHYMAWTPTLPYSWSAYKNLQIPSNVLCTSQGLNYRPCAVSIIRLSSLY